MATADPSHREDSWAIQMQFANGGIGIVHYVCGSERGWDRETVDILGGGRSATIAGFRRLTLRGSGTGQVRRKMQPDLGQQQMLQQMVAQFSGEATEDLTESFLLSARAVLAARRSIAERRTGRSQRPTVSR